MDEFSDNSAALNDDDYESRRYENLPPVEPPSAGFIVQLFVVPALIVMVVVGVWALFGKLAAGEQDWRTLVSELRNENEHRRWRGALGLAQLLKADENRTDSEERLATNPLIARELAQMLDQQLDKNAPKDDDLKHQAFLALTLGMLDTPGEVLPVLREAMQPAEDREVRKNAIASVSLISGRMDDRGEPLSDSETVDALVAVSADEDPLLRQMAAYALGLAPSAATTQRLSVLLGDPDANTRVNAAVGLARQDSTRGLPVFESILASASQPTQHAAADNNEAARRGFEQLVALKNSLKAVGDLSGQLSQEDRDRVRALVAPIAENYREAKIRLDAEQTLRALDGAAA